MNGIGNLVVMVSKEETEDDGSSRSVRLDDLDMLRAQCTGNLQLQSTDEGGDTDERMKRYLGSFETIEFCHVFYF